MEGIAARPEAAAEPSATACPAPVELRPGTFSALVLGILGFLLMAAAAAQSQLFGFLIYALPDAVVVGIALFRYRCKGVTRSSSNGRGSLSFRSTGSLALPFAGGAVLGWTLKVQALLVLGLVVCGFALLPWQRLSFHSRYLKTSLCLVAAGIGLVWLPFSRPTPPVILAAMGWFVSLGALLAVARGK